MTNDNIIVKSYDTDIAVDDDSLAPNPAALLSKKIQVYASQIPQDFLDLSEEDLHELVHPTTIDNMLRTRIWSVYTQCLAKKKTSIRNHEIYQGICTPQTFYTIAQNPKRFAWMLHPPPGYLERLEETLDFGLDRLRKEVMTAKLLYPNGHLDAKAAQVFMNAVEYLDARVRGAVIQRIKTESVNVNVDVSKQASPESMEEIDKRIKELRAKFEAVYALPQSPTNNSDAIDVDVEEV